MDEVLHAVIGSSLRDSTCTCDVDGVEIEVPRNIRFKLRSL